MNPRRIAIVDDDEDSRVGFSLMLEDEGYECFEVTGSFISVDELVALIRKNADAALCDHRLRHGGLGDFDGAEVVASLQRAGIPAVLISQYLHIDAPTTVRKFRDLIPSAIARADAEFQSWEALFAKALSEIQGERGNERKAHRSLVTVSEVTGEGDAKVVDVFAIGWRPQDAVRLPFSMIAEDVSADKIYPGATLIADINIGADDSDELFFSNFEVAPEPDEDDGLG